VGAKTKSYCSEHTERVDTGISPTCFSATARITCPWIEGRGDRAASAALKQLVFGVGDAVAVGLRLDDRILRQRFQPASEAELRDWADVWMNLHGAVAHDGR
jgi:hypothetical protein